MPLSPIPSTLPTSTYEHLVLEALGEIAVGSTINYNPPILDTALFRHLVLNALQYIANNPGGGGTGTVTSITGGSGLNGGTITSSGTLSVIYGTLVNTACQGNDSRLSNSRTPTAHASTHAAAGTDPVTVTLTSQVTGTLPVANGGTGSTTAANALTALGAVAKTGDTMTGKLNLPASTLTSVPLNLGNGISPTTLVAGDLFYDGALKYQDSIGTRLVAATNKFNSFADWQSINLNRNTTPALLVTQNGNGGGIKIVNPTGTGESLRIEDESPETTPFVVSATGKVGIGVTPDAAVALSVDTTGVKFGDGTIQTTAATGSGTVTSVTGTSPIASSGGATPAISIANAEADGATKGAAAFNASDFDATAGVVSIDYTNGQAASASNKGFLTATDWTTFNSKGAGTVTSVTATSPITSTGGATPVISTSMATNRLLGRSTAATGVAEEISIGTGLSLSAGTLSNAGVLSDTTAAQGGTQLLNMVQITSAAYSAIVTPTANTLYIIVG